jgi:hypothetical protein
MKRHGWLILAAGLLATACLPGPVHADTPRVPAAGSLASAGTDWGAVVEVTVDPLVRRSRPLLWVLEKVGVIETWVPEEARRLPPRRYLEHRPQPDPPSRPAVPAA